MKRPAAAIQRTSFYLLGTAGFAPLCASARLHLLCWPCTDKVIRGYKYAPANDSLLVLALLGTPRPRDDNFNQHNRTKRSRKVNYSYMDYGSPESVIIKPGTSSVHKNRYVGATQDRLRLVGTPASIFLIYF